MGKAEISLRGANLRVRLMFSFWRAGAIIRGTPQSTPVYDGRQLHLEGGRLGEVVDDDADVVELDLDAVEVDLVDDVEVGEVDEVGSSAKPFTKQERLPIVTK